MGSGISYDPEFADVDQEGYISGPVSVTSVATEAKVGASRMSRREGVNITNKGPDIIYYGPSGVTDTTGDVLAVNQYVSLNYGDLVPVYLICSSGKSATAIVQEGTVIHKTVLIDAVYNNPLPSLLNGQTSAFQVDSSGRLIIAPLTSSSIVSINNLPTTVDVNYGTVGASTLRSAAQIGNATGAADFNSGATGAQTLRVAANQGAPNSLANKWPVQITDGTNTMPTMDVIARAGFQKITDGTNTATIKAASTAAAAADTSVVVALSPNSPLPAGTNIIGKVSQDTSPWITKDQSDGPVTPGTVASFSQLAGGQYNAALPTLTTGQQAALQLDSSGRLIVAATVSSTGTIDKTAFTYGTSTDQIVGGVYQDTSPTLTAGQGGAVRLTSYRAFHVNLRDANGNEKLAQQTMANSIPVVIASDQSNVPISDIININSQYRNQSVTAVAAEALGGATILANRKSISIIPTNGTIWWGTNNSVTSLTGMPIFKNQLVTLSFGPNVHVYVISSGTVDCRIMEGS